MIQGGAASPHPRAGDSQSPGLGVLPCHGDGEGVGAALGAAAGLGRALGEAAGPWQEFRAPEVIGEAGKARTGTCPHLCVRASGSCSDGFIN